MPKWLGGIFGNTISSTATGADIRGVFNSQDQYYMKQEGGWAFPTYSVSPSTSSVNEGSSVTFTTTTTSVSNGTTLYWTLNVVSGTINASDFSGGATSGFFTITSNSGSVVLTLANDVTTEGSESFQLQVRTGSTGGPIVATSSTVTINDTSLTQISATGGTIIDSGGFRTHVFTSPGSFVVSNAGPGTVEYLVVAGGGGAGAGHGGGGGAGGFRTATGFPVTTATYPITVGGGGAGGPTYGTTGSVGSSSIFSSITSAGGGGGACWGYPAGVLAASSGGSGGGGTGTGATAGGSGNTPPVAPPQGNPGGSGTGTAGSTAVAGGGGGGSASTGGNAPNTTTPGVGGSGSPNSWLPASYGTPGPAPGRYFAGGGGGGGSSGNTANVSGGSGGGGTGNAPTVSPGTTNTGGGGGGNFPATAGGTGGSGIVAIRYPYV